MNGTNRDEKMGHEKIDEKTIERIDGAVTITDTPLNGRILDVGGGGEGIIGQEYGRDVVAIDLSKGELEEAPGDAVKLVMDAREMTFLDNMFDSAALFFTLMYMAPKDAERTITECARVLKPGGTLAIWDMEIPENTTEDKLYYVIYLDVELSTRTISTGYGTRWDKTQSMESISKACERCGFEILEKRAIGHAFSLVCRIPKNKAAE